MLYGTKYRIQLDFEHKTYLSRFKRSDLRLTFTELIHATNDGMDLMSEFPCTQSQPAITMDPNITEDIMCVVSKLSTIQFYGFRVSTDTVLKSWSLLTQSSIFKTSF